uniref:Uncharacterized protein n=1 Tax=Timema poppense TaxID=170557 RepID=A0A7R9CMU9_TIMPO|nr:unnamed protein product [Timema poppensis]
MPAIWGQSITIRANAAEGSRSESIATRTLKPSLNIRAESKMKPAGHSHLNEPSVLMQSPPSQALGIKEHSFKSSPVSPLPGPCGQSRANSSETKTTTCKWRLYYYNILLRTSPEHVITELLPYVNTLHAILTEDVTLWTLAHHTTVSVHTFTILADAHVIYLHFHGRRVENDLGKTTLSRTDRDLNPDLLIISRPVLHDHDNLDHSATEAGPPGHRALNSSEPSGGHFSHRGPQPLPTEQQQVARVMGSPIS